MSCDHCACAYSTSAMTCCFLGFHVFEKCPSRDYTLLVNSARFSPNPETPHLPPPISSSPPPYSTVPIFTVTSLVRRTMICTDRASCAQCMNSKASSITRYFAFAQPLQQRVSSACNEHSYFSTLHPTSAARQRLCLAYTARVIVDNATQLPQPHQLRAQQQYTKRPQGGAAALHAAR